MTKARAIASVAAALGIAGLAVPVMAAPESSHYRLDNYSFAGGSQVNASSSSYTVDGAIGSVYANNASSAAYTLDSGMTILGSLSPPPAPAFTNPGSTYDRLKLVIHTGGASADTLYAAAISGDGWATTQYIQSDFTPGSALGEEDWLTEAQWGGALGKMITNLAENTTYSVKIKAKQGSTQSTYSPETSAQTSVPSLSFGIDSVSIAFDPLIPENNRTDDTKQTVLTTSTNAYNGYVVYAHAAGPLTSGGRTIADFAAPNSLPEAWVGYGFGYTTNDSDLGGGTANRFTSGGPKYAGFTTSSPGDPVADHIEKVEGTPIDHEQFTVSYKIAAPDNTVAGTYKTTLQYIVVPAY